MRAYNIVLVQPPGYVHTLCFVEIGKLLLNSFRSLGVECKFQINGFDPGAINIILGYNVITDPSAIPSCDYVIYQLEQLADREGWFQPTFLEIYRCAREVWDYAEENLRFLQAQGIGNARLLSIGFHEALRTIPHQVADIDVLFYGSLNQRRRTVLDDLAQNCTVKTLFGVYGADRDHWIARSKIVLNIHYYEAQIMEQPRVSYLLNNRRFVISEQSKVNPYAEGLVAVPYDQLANTCRVWLGRPAEREQMAQAGLDLLQSRPMTEYLHPLIQSIS